ncbi:hypothetical protein L2E82_51118 [Cichorium intybus]|nr:hypothetical protein L2E82_51118 [Cichorium intybus]
MFCSRICPEFVKIAFEDLELLEEDELKSFETSARYLCAAATANFGANKSSIMVKSPNFVSFCMLFANSISLWLSITLMMMINIVKTKNYIIDPHNLSSARRMSTFGIIIGTKVFGIGLAANVLQGMESENQAIQWFSIGLSASLMVPIISSAMITCRLWKIPRDPLHRLV